MIDAVLRSLGSVRRGRGAGVAIRAIRKAPRQLRGLRSLGMRPAEQGPRSCLEAVRGDEDGVQAVGHQRPEGRRRSIVTQSRVGHQHM